MGTQEKQTFRIKTPSEENDMAGADETPDPSGSPGIFKIKSGNGDASSSAEPMKFKMKDSPAAGKSKTMEQHEGEEHTTITEKKAFKVKDPPVKKGRFSFRKKEGKAAEQTKEKEKAAFKIKEPVEKKERFSFKKKEPKVAEEPVPEKEIMSFRKKEPKAIPEPAPMKEIISFKKKLHEEAEEIIGPKEKISFKEKEPMITEETPAETLSFVKKEIPSHDETPIPGSEISRESSTLEIEKEKQAAEKMRFSSKPAEKKRRKYLKSMKKKVSRTSEGIERSFLGRLFSSPILNGIVLGLVSMVILLLMTVMKDSQSSSIFYRACFLPQVFLIYVTIVAIVYMASIILILIGVNRRFRDK